MDTVRIIPLLDLELPVKLQISAGQRESAKIWNICKELHLEARREQQKWPTKSTFQKATKGQVELYSQSIQQTFLAFLGNIEATKKKRLEYPNQKSKIKYPWRTKRFYPIIWPAQHLAYTDGVLALPMGRCREAIRLKVDIKPDFKVAKLVWNNGYELHLTYESSELKTQQSEVRATVDLGEIHTAAVTTNQGDGLIISGRGIRTLKRQRHRILRTFQKKLSRCKRYSKRWWALTNRKHELCNRINRRIRDLRHKVWRQVIDWCAERNVSQIYVGDPHGVRRRNCGRKHNQRMATWEYGQDKQYLTYKGALVGITVTSGTERGTSSTCPICGHKHKPRGRVWHCKKCGFIGHRDLVGSVNMHVIGFGESVPFPSNITYLRPEKLGRSSKVRHKTLSCLSAKDSTESMDNLTAPSTSSETGRPRGLSPHPIVA